MEELLKLKEVVMARRSKAPANPEVLAETGIGADRSPALRAVLLPVLNITIAHGGIKHNIVPDEFVIEGDRRVIPEEDPAEVVREIEEAVSRARARDPKLDCELAVNPIYVAFYGDPQHPFVQKVRRTVRAVTGLDVPVAASNGSTDVGYTVRKTGLVSAAYGVGRYKESNGHGADENCRISDLLDTVKVVCALAAGVVE